MITRYNNEFIGIEAGGPAKSKSMQHLNLWIKNWNSSR